jgi:hypothetical protein
MSKEEEDACHIRKRTHVTECGGCMSFEEEDACHMIVSTSHTLPASVEHRLR